MIRTRQHTSSRLIIGKMITLRCLIFGGLLVSASTLLALTPNTPAGTLQPDMLVQTRNGTVDCIIAIERPHVPPIRGHARGVYAADIAVATGYVYAVRVVESSGDSALDNAMLNALQQWRFRPRIIYKLVVPVDFSGSIAHLGGR
jgi:hypothetical protein